MLIVKALVSSTNQQQIEELETSEQLHESLNLVSIEDAQPGESVSVKPIMKHEGDEPEAPLLPERNNVAGKVDAVSGGGKGYKADHDPGEALQSRRGVQHGSEERHWNRTRQRPIPAHLYCQRQADAT